MSSPLIVLFIAADGRASVNSRDACGAFRCRAGALARARLRASTRVRCVLARGSRARIGSCAAHALRAARRARRRPACDPESTRDVDGPRQARPGAHLPKLPIQAGAPSSASSPHRAWALRWALSCRRWQAGRGVGGAQRSQHNRRRTAGVRGGTRAKQGRRRRHVLPLSRRTKPVQPPTNRPSPGGKMWPTSPPTATGNVCSEGEYASITDLR